MKPAPSGLPLLSLSCLLAGLLASPGEAAAHERSNGAAWVQPQGGGLRLRVELDAQLASELRLARPADEPARVQLAGRLLAVAVDGAPCPVARADFTETPTGAWHLSAATAPCPGQRLKTSSPLFDEASRQQGAQGHLLITSVQQGFHTERCVFGSVSTPCEVALQSARAQGTAPPPASPATRPARSLFVPFLAHGAEHIARGLDHLLFVALVLVGATRLRDALWRLTAFSAGHALTLSLVALAAITPPSRPVEVGIALSLVALGLRRLRPGPEGAAWLTALFGLLHGLGFGAGLRDLGFDRGSALPSLLGFHLGVEAGQLAAAALFWTLVRWQQRLGRELPVRRAVGAVGVALGALWTLQRLG